MTAPSSQADHPDSAGGATDPAQDIGASQPGRVELDVLDWRRQVFRLYAEVRASHDPAQAHANWVAARAALIRDHPASPRRGAAAIVAAYDPAWRFEAALVPAEPERMEIPTGTDGVVPFERIGRLVLRNDQHDAGTLDVWALRSYGGGLFVPLRDASAGRTSYGGGRYLLDTIKGADLGGAEGSITVDVNFAYNPSCAYDPAWACPLAPPGNVLRIDVPIGERIPA